MLYSNETSILNNKNLYNQKMASLTYIESDDEWIDSCEPEHANRGSNAIEKVSVTYDMAEATVKDLGLIHFMDTGTHCVLNRCEPVKKMYPSVFIPERLRKYNSLVLSIILYHHNCESVDVRFPDLKDKFQLHRDNHGVWINPSETPIIRLKKKAFDAETKKDTAFRLSTDFKFHTNGIEPCFVLTAIPFENGKFIQKEASVSKPFFVRSKRQERHTNGPKKKRKKAREIRKINTDIYSSEEQLGKLKTRLKQLTSQNSVNATLFREMRQSVVSMPTSTTKIALQHAFRAMSTTESVTL